MKDMIPAEVISSPEAIDAATKTIDIEQEVSFLTIDSNDMYDLAGQQLRLIVTQKSEIEAHRVRLKAPILEAGRNLDEFFKIPLGRLERSESELKRRMAAYYAEQQQRLRDAQEEALAAQRDAAAEAEAIAKATEDKAVALAAEDPDGALRLAEQAEMERARADEIKHTNIVVPTEVPISSGVAVKENWQVACDDINELIAAAAADPKLRYLICFDQKAGNALAKSSKGKVAIPGLRFFDKGTVAARKTTTKED